MSHCCFCDAEVPDDPLISPFTYAEDEFPQIYAHVCPKCVADCRAGLKSKNDLAIAVDHPSAQRPA